MLQAAIPSSSEKRITELRAQIPAPILKHYDRLADRGKKGVALLQHQTCSACHISVPLATVLELSHGNDVRICDSCGRYLYLREDGISADLAVPVKSSAQSRRKHLIQIP